jgi:hypothetical protein
VKTTETYKTEKSDGRTKTEQGFSGSGVFAS